MQSTNVQLSILYAKNEKDAALFGKVHPRDAGKTFRKL